MIPTNAQLKTCFDLCQRLTLMYRSIGLVCFDETSGNIFILAGDETEILIYPDGRWRFQK
ncbi:MAG: hypothetical protein B0A82_20865 [Alkalinema sp. CACIAM 70d]|nr:MAG: hypothetical protein B0A82_20865 [Alkalinema sp. CACIAM 70d]